MQVFACTDRPYSAASLSSVQLLLSDDYAFSATATGVANAQMLRHADCFNHIPRGRSFDFYVRTRPDLQFFPNAVLPLAQWSRNRVSVRMRSDERPLPPVCTSWWGVELGNPDRGRLVDDQMWIVPRSIAAAAFAVRPGGDPECAWPESFLLTQWESLGVAYEPSPFNVRLSSYNEPFDRMGHHIHGDMWVARAAWARAVADGATPRTPCVRRR